MENDAWFVKGTAAALSLRINRNHLVRRLPSQTHHVLRLSGFRSFGLSLSIEKYHGGVLATSIASRWGRYFRHFSKGTRRAKFRHRLRVFFLKHTGYFTLFILLA